MHFVLWLSWTKHGVPSASLRGLMALTVTEMLPFPYPFPCCFALSVAKKPDVTVNSVSKRNLTSHSNHCRVLLATMEVTVPCLMVASGWIYVCQAEMLIMKTNLPKLPAQGSFCKVPIQFLFLSCMEGLGGDCL